MEISKLKDEINKLKEEINKLKEENKKLKKERTLYKSKYNKYSQSRLGKLTTLLWTIRSYGFKKSLNKLVLLLRRRDSSLLVHNPFTSFREDLNNGNISNAINNINQALIAKPNNINLKIQLSICKDKYDLLNNNDFLESCLGNAHGLNFKGSNKILHVLNTSPPYLNNGYSVRSRYICDFQKKMGLDISVVTRPGFPSDFQLGDLSEVEVLVEELFEIPYYRVNQKKFLRNTPMKHYIEVFSEGIKETARKTGSNIIHAASNYTIGLAGLKAARELNLPYIYEIRGFWEMTRASKNELFEDSEEYQMTQKIELFLAQNADKVVVISEGLRDYLIEKGVSNEKIYLLPNGVDVKKFTIQDKNINLANEYDIKGKLVFGYIGSLVKYEGIQVVLEALKNLKTKGFSNFKYIVVGDGNYRKELELLVGKYGLSNHVVFVGKIDHDCVLDYYSLFDVCVYFREESKVTSIVTPLKPLEAMACGKIVVASDVKALREMLHDGINGLIVNNNIEDLTNSLEDIYCNQDKYDYLRKNSREWVKENRSWENIVSMYTNLYNNFENVY